MVLLKNEGRVLPLSLGDDDAEEEAGADADAAAVAVERRLRRGHDRRHDHPMRPGRGRGGALSVAVVGPHGNATEALLGNYFGNPPFIVSPLEGIQQCVA